MAAPAVVVPSAHIIQLVQHRDGGKALHARKQKHALQHPEWRLAEDADPDWSKCHGTVLDASYSALPSLDPIAATAPVFNRLTVLCLRESSVVDIELLRRCTTLVHLDLSSNEIFHLVGGDFWASFRELLVLLLHGNKVAEWRAVESLGKAPKLAYLTLFFNPVCKKKMYRPFTTNCCQSLRGLDLYAVSDEEVVEGSEFCSASRFKTCSNSLALPQPLFKGLAELPFLPTKQEERTAQDRIVDDDQHPLSNTPTRDALVLASVRRRVQLLRKFHARNSPVIVGQRQIRRFLRERFGSEAAVKIQTRVRRWIVWLRAAAAVRDILRSNDELYLVQEMMTPTQLRSLTWFQRRIAGHFRFRVLVSCARVLERFITKVAKRFTAFVESIEDARVGGIVVGHGQSGDLAAAVARALVVTTPGLTWAEATERTETMVTTVPGCRCVRPYTYLEMPGWPAFEKDANTDGVFVTRSVAGVDSRAPGLTNGSFSTPKLTRPAPSRPLSGLRDMRPRSRARSRVRNRPGIFGSPRVRQCKLSRRVAPVRNLHRDAATKAKTRDTLAARENVHEQLWMFRPTETRILARVLCTLRYGSVGERPVPFILERQLFRCASATRIQAAWRGHVLRWVLVDTLASCVIVGRAGVCIQRWWRYQRGLSTRLGLCRRLWAIASAVWSPVMYIELDVFYTLTRGWQWDSGEESVLFTFQDGNRVAAVNPVSDPASCALDSMTNTGSGQNETKAAASISAAARGRKRKIGRELPMWALGSVVQQVSLSEVQHGRVLNQMGALLTVGVQAKKLVWPLAPGATNAVEPSEDVGGVRSKTGTHPEELDGGCEVSSGSFSTGICLTSARSEEVCDHARSFRAHQAVGLVETDLPIDLGTKARGEVELLELTFSCVQEARARAILLALGTEEPGAYPSRPIAQLMTLEMLRRAAAGEPGQAVPILRTPAQGFRRGDKVEVSLLRLSEGHGGAWFPATVDWKSTYGSLYRVTLDNGLVEHDVQESSIRPHDCTGKEPMLVEMSHLPSRWQQNVRSILTPADRLDLELLRRSLPTTTPAKPSLDRPVQLFSSDPRQEASARVSPDHQRQFDGLDVRGLLIEPRPVSPGSPVGCPGLAKAGPSPPRWASSQTMTAARTAGGLAAEALEKVARAAAAADKAAVASTWVPGNRFRVGLEKLVHLATHEAQTAAGKDELSARRDTVSRARHAERAEPSPRERLEKLKAAEVAIFRRESDEIRERAAFERAIQNHELKTNAVDAREYMQNSQRQTAEALEAELATKMKDTKRREIEVEVERRRSLEKRQADVEAAKARIVQGREGRAKQALSFAESRAFTANASQLARLVGKHSTTSCKVQTKRGLRRWVKGQKTRKEDMRLRMLKRVQELQERKRSEATRLRRTLAARGRARLAMDEAVIRHRIGQTMFAGDNLTEDVLQVMRPRSRLEGGGDRQDDDDFGPVYDKGGGDNNARVLCSDMTQLGRPVGTGSAVQRRRLVAPAPTTVDGDARGGAVPSKPDAPRLRHQEQRKKNRRLYANDAGKTVVVLASIPSVTREARPTGPLPGSKNSRSSTSPERGAGKASSDHTVLPWPLGRRCW